MAHPSGCCAATACGLPIATVLKTRTKESDMRASRRVLKPGMRKEADEREALTGRTAGRPLIFCEGFELEHACRDPERW
ncbi:hypothetical protein C2845_PMPSC055533 [Panicum miliaceum]|uniref:Uncharacterized protein n=1 Tax=Panicum miliaceum TaxID=4540 RepID=A0A3L6PCI0_PANMI|nr:hypothetical protein C2845_PMPSC055533 [Panicum miliaceum]